MLNLSSNGFEAEVKKNGDEIQATYRKHDMEKPFNLAALLTPVILFIPINLSLYAYNPVTLIQVRPVSIETSIY